MTQSPLCEPATEQELAALQSRFELVPAQLIELLSCANGEVDSSFKSDGMIAFEAFISSEQIVQEFDFVTSYGVYDDLNQFVEGDRIDSTGNGSRV